MRRECLGLACLAQQGLFYRSTKGSWCSAVEARFRSPRNILEIEINPPDACRLAHVRLWWCWGQLGSINRLDTNLLHFLYSECTAVICLPIGEVRHKSCNTLPIPIAPTVTGTAEGMTRGGAWGCHFTAHTYTYTRTSAGSYITMSGVSSIYTNNLCRKDMKEGKMFSSQRRQCLCYDEKFHSLERKNTSLKAIQVPVPVLGG